MRSISIRHHICGIAMRRVYKRGGRVFAKHGSRNVHSIIPNEREWLSVLCCINAEGEAIPNFYILKGKRMRRNFLELANPGDTMAMQPQAWMTTFLFDAWISHFIQALGMRGGISAKNRHLLVVDGHNSHVTLQVVCKAAAYGLDIITLPSHTSHCLQSLDVSIFRPFKCSFRKFQDAWTLRNKYRGATKEDLCHWVCQALKKALSPNNITKGFRKTSIFPLNEHAVDDKMGPIAQFVPRELVQESSFESDEGEDLGDTSAMEEVLGDRVPESQKGAVQYFVPTDVDMGTAGASAGSSSDSETSSLGGTEQAAHMAALLELPTVGPSRPRCQSGEPLVDYSKSIILTKDDYIRMMEAKERRKEQAMAEAAKRKVEAERKKLERARLKVERDVQKAQRLTDAVALKAFKDKWSPTAVAKASQELHDRIKSGVLPPPGAYTPPFLGVIPHLCKDNQLYRKARMWAKKHERQLL
jgi:hypothetical protein